ncbi:MAG: ABC transporter ATP-binding protein [Lachnospiraceae bacterium]|nr:ABC transporter ATP-binding protein [Lachnospiraceae bacterium]
MEMKNNNEEILHINNLVVEYSSGKEKVHAVNDVSFGLGGGETLGLVGETGAGKTTIAKSILRILPDMSAKIQSGEIIFNGENLLELSEHQMGRVRGNYISMIFQDPMTALNPIMRVGNQIADGIKIHQNVTKAEARKQAEEMLEMVGIPRERYGDYPHQFSGGMKQRIVIAIALACHPKLLIADEPTSALDVTIQAQIMEMIKKLQNESGTAMILITHDLGIVAENCDRVAVVYAGQIVEYGTKRDIFKRTAHPYTMGLFKALPNMNEDTERLMPISGQPVDPTKLPQGCSFHPRCQYATEKCRTQAVPLIETEDGHLCRCHYCRENLDRFHH